jgi:hypothetical protein
VIHLPFADRAEAGRLLAAELATLELPANVIVLALPRGGLPVAWERALALRIMAAKRVRRLPVVDHGGALLGILSLDDVALQARHHGDTDRPPVSFEDVMLTLRAIYKHGSRADARLPTAA